MKIDSFRGEHDFLSNFYPVQIKYEGVLYPSVEHYYVAMKSDDRRVREMVAKIDTPGKVKRYGREFIKLRDDWEDVKMEVMEYGLNQKFMNKELRDKLLSTGDSEIIEGNVWHDNFWGTCKCEKCGDRGQNNLGELLMKIRNKLKKQI